MTKEEKFTSVTVYLAKVVDHLQGIEEAAPHPGLPRTSRVIAIGTELTEAAQSLNALRSKGAATRVNKPNPNPLYVSENITRKEHE